MAEHSAHALLRMVQSAYTPTDSLESWLDGLTARLSTLAANHHGAVGRIVDVSTGQTHGNYSLHVNDSRVHDALLKHHSQSAHRIDFLTVNGPGLYSARLAISTKFNDDVYLSEMMKRFRAFGAEDMLHLTAYDGERFWVTLGILTKDDAKIAWSPRSWAMACIHFATALRLQKRAVDLLDHLPSDAAVLSTDGTILHAEGRAKRRKSLKQLRESVRQVDAARCREVSEPDRALSLWQGLIDGRWSCVDQYDTDGRRYIVAVPNPVQARDFRSLSSREAQVAAFAAEAYSEKWIGYTLGLSRTAVATHLKSALEKLGLPSRLMLTKIFRGATEA